MSQRKQKTPFRGRSLLLSFVIVAVGVGLAARAFELQVLQHDFLQKQGDMRHLRTVSTPAVRGMITDRNGLPLAISTPVKSVWANPQELLAGETDITELANMLQLDADSLRQRLIQNSSREFVYLRRHIHPELGEQVDALGLPGVYMESEYRRYYPSGSATAHVVGLSNIDDEGQEGMELAFNGWLNGKGGAKRVLRDRFGRAVRNIELVREAEPGKALKLSIDERLQYLASRELERVVTETGAASGSVVMLDPRSGEILSLANLPTYNPNRRGGVVGEGGRNRALTDVIEPGSVMKPFTAALALESGLYTPQSQLATSPGTWQVGELTVRDFRDYGTLSLTGVLAKSSNVGISKVALDLGAENLYQGLRGFGFGEVTGSGFPGESPGVLPHWQRWHRVREATISYGYGLSVTPLQLAQAYSVIANGGVLRSPTLVHGAETDSRRVLSAKTANQLAHMLEMVVAEDGTGHAAALPMYRVAGKTGTARKADRQGYSNRYVATFAGFLPASDPRLVVVVVVNDPAGEEYYGGQVAAPVFKRIAGEAMRLLDVRPDGIEDRPNEWARQSVVSR